MVRQPNTKSRRLHSVDGFTILELLVSVALVGITALAAGSLWISYTKGTQRVTRIIENQLDTGIAERVFLKDIQQAEVSFHTLGLSADQRGLNFFDLAKDVNCICTKTLQSECVSWLWKYGGASGACERSITINKVASKRSKPFYLLLEDRKDGSAFPFQVTAAYNVSKPTRLGEAGALSYVGLGRTIVTTKVIRPIDETSKIVNNGATFWDTSKNKLIMLNVPLPLRGAKSDQSIDETTFPKMAVLLGTQRNLDLNIFKSPDSSLALRMEHPLNRSSSFGSVDDFFRRMPLLAGLVPQVMVRATTLIRYQIDETGSLVRAEFDPIKGSFGTPLKLADSVEHLTFSRRINESLVRFVVKLEDKR